MRVFLTGATGLIGSHLAKYLVERGDEVVALVRPTSDTGFLDSLEVVDLVHGDVSDSVDSLCSVMDGCSHVVHAAALVYSGRGWDAVAAVNVEGTRRVLMAAATSGVQKAVNISSVAVYGGELPEVLDDMTALRPQSSYGSPRGRREPRRDPTAGGTVEPRLIRAPRFGAPMRPSLLSA